MSWLEDKQAEIESILCYSQGFDSNHIDLSWHMTEWEIKKSRFIEWFGGDTTICLRRDLCPYSELTLTENYEKFLREMESTIFPSMSRSKVVAMKDFLDINKNSFFDNRIAVATNHEMRSGAKLTKAFKCFIENETVLRMAQDIASKYIQIKKIKGNLYLTVDPAEFLLMSDTNANWDSCHTLDGDYRSGNLAYMLDDVTFIAYFASAEKEVLRPTCGDIEYHNKKWRMLVHVHPDGNIIYYNRQYPYENVELEGIVKNYISQFFYSLDRTIERDCGFKTITTGCCEHKLLHNHIFFKDNIYNTDDLIDSSHLIFCDIRSSHVYTPHFQTKAPYRYARYSREEIRDAWFMKIGADDIPCVVKGCDKCIADSEGFTCASHDGSIGEICNICGHRIYSEDNYFVDRNGAYYCSDCYPSYLDDSIEDYDEGDC